MSTDKTLIGVIGGSGLNKPTIVDNHEEVNLETPFGQPSDCLIRGQINGVECVMLCRHGRHHTLSPSHINYRANIWALKQIGCTHIVATTACGSLQESIQPGDLVLLDQFIDRTTKRASTFYDLDESPLIGISHIPMDVPFCEHTTKILVSSAKELGLSHHPAGTVVTIEGPRFSSRAESKLYKSWGADVINMTTIPEATLAKELGLCYSAIALVTDYDCWRENEPGVSQSSVMETMSQNFDKVIRLLHHSLPKIAEHDFSAVLETNKNVAQSSVVLPPSF